ncbi:helix-turn-helix domain-containing protein [Halobellus limi]|uniref:DNA-binding protein n=1 Tax=Halobellus limi TaxID=699433 RepID=A0A1H6BU65_9EURY|nr:helix-turn-helix domain-containing protein [Halobellus limi]QCC49486.1 DNA-binding protein [Halobellus limi]SEG63987.1 HTH DNA binding domain-containing protein [Halobellus limi]
MRYLQLQIQFSSEARHPMHQFLVEHDSVRQAYLRHWNFSNPEYVTTLLHVVGNSTDGRDEYLSALDAVDTISEYDVTPIDDRSFYVYIREAAQGFARQLRVLLTDTELLVVPPIEYDSDGSIRFEIAGDQDALQNLVTEFPEHLSVSINRLGEYDAYREPQTVALTERQREVLEVAREQGYYEIPRQTSVREIADEIGCSKSTAAGHLRKAEARLVSLYGSQPIVL